jgi:hypothetical protein
MALIKGYLETGAGNNNEQGGISFQVRPVGTSTSLTEAMHINSAGNIGIGTIPGYPLHVVGGPGNYVTQAAGYVYNSSGSFVYGSGGTISGGISIWCDRYMFSPNGVVVASDERIKKNITEIEDPISLLQNLKLKSYNYIDPAKGTNLKYGFIAQDLLEILPGTVKSINSIIPNIFRVATGVSSNVITLENHNLLVNQNIKIVKYDNSEIVTNVSKVIDDNTFQISDEYTENKAFIYGVEVDDFLSVDYDQIACLALGSVQQMSATIQTHQAQITELSAENTALKTQMTSLEQSLATVQAETAGLAARLTALESKLAA